MLSITYFNGGDTEVKTYDSASAFVTAQLLEVPSLPDHLKIKSVVLDDEEVELSDKTILGLFNYLNK